MPRRRALRPRLPRPDGIHARAGLIHHSKSGVRCSVLHAPLAPGALPSCRAATPCVARCAGGRSGWPGTAPLVSPRPAGRPAARACRAACSRRGLRRTCHSRCTPAAHEAWTYRYPGRGELAAASNANRQRPAVAGARNGRGGGGDVAESVQVVCLFAHAPVVGCRSRIRILPIMREGPAKCQWFECIVPSRGAGRMHSPIRGCYIFPVRSKAVNPQPPRRRAWDGSIASARMRRISRP